MAPYRFWRGRSLRVEEKILAEMIRLKRLGKQGRSVIGPVFHRLTSHRIASSKKLEEKGKRIECVLCGSEINLDHGAFDDYRGPVKCFCCGTMMDIKTSSGVLESINLMDISPDLPSDYAAERSILTQQK